MACRFYNYGYALYAQYFDQHKFYIKSRNAIVINILLGLVIAETAIDNLQASLECFGHNFQMLPNEGSESTQQNPMLDY